MPINYCKGCITYTREHGCHFSAHNDEAEGQCPCSQCIVKVMCENMCVDFMSYKKFMRKYYMI